MNKKINYNSNNIQLRFYEIDSYGIVNNMFCYSWFEYGRFSIAERVGLAHFLNDRSYAILVSRTEANYHRSIHFSDSISCLTSINRITGSKIIFDHKIISTTNSVCFITGKTEVVLLRNGKLMLKYPEEITKSILKYVFDVQGGFSEE